jgi:hypothetical protein
MEPKQTIPVYSIFNDSLGEMTIAEALRHREEGEMILTTKGRGRNRRYTSCRWIVYRKQSSWRPTDSGGFTVMQLVYS